MNKPQCYLFSILSIALALLPMTIKPVIGLIFGSALTGLGWGFFLIGENK